MFESGFDFLLQRHLDSRMLIVFLIFRTDKSEENFLWEGMDILIFPLKKDMDSQLKQEKDQGEFPRGEINT